MDKMAMKRIPESLLNPDETDEAIEIPIEDEIDLHTFRPKEVPDLLSDYFEACIQKGILSVRVIHGKGQGFLREKVHSFLKHCPMVERFGLAPGSAGGWGATVVDLRNRA
jgi:dsDNA-specific endonuclease/ATPase MutS2